MMYENCMAQVGCIYSAEFFQLPVRVYTIAGDGLPADARMHTAIPCWILLVHTIFITALPPVIKIGAIFSEDMKGCSAELAFKYAVYRINKDRALLPQSTLVYDIQYVPKKDSFRATKKACNQIESGVLALFGPQEQNIGSTVQGLCEAMDVPHMEASPDHLEPREFSINLHPSQSLLDKAFIDFMTYLNWTRVAILYEDVGNDVFRFQALSRLGTELYIRRCEGPTSYRPILSEIKAKKITNIIIDTNPVYIQNLFRAILQLQMNSHRYHYLFASFDMELFDLEDFYFNKVNMSGWRLVDLDSDRVKEILQQMQTFHPMGSNILSKNGTIETTPALIYDAVRVLTLGLAALQSPLRPANLSCETSAPWDDGLTLYNYISSVSAHGVTGPIEFTEGRRTGFRLQLLRLRGSALETAGTWTPGSGLELTDPFAFRRESFPNVTLVVVTREVILEKPYVMVKEGWNLQGNDRFEGFCIDLLRRIAARVGFAYTLKLVPDNMYGVFDPETNQWNGIVKELADKKADLAVASMTINYARETVIDFTKPFMNLGIGILFKVPTSQPTRLFSFLNPLAVEIWLYVLAAYVLVSFTLFVMARFSPYEWSNPHPCARESRLVTNQFSVSNSFWFITGTFLRQGSGLNPKATSTRIVGGIWWFFTLIIISSYTANLAAFLTVERTVAPIETVADLAGQSVIQYGTLNGGSTMSFFRDSKIDIYKQMWRYMESHKPSVFVSTYEDGVKRVLGGGYAFLMESTMLDHRVQRDCNLTQVGGLLDSKGYGIATGKGSPWRDKISLAILHLQEKGVVQILYDKWWKNTGDVCNREDKTKDSKANALGVQNIGGVFVVLLCGLALAILVAILEFCWNSKKNAAQGRQSLCSEMGQELRFAVRCGGGARQRPALRRHCARCAAPATYVPSAHYNGELTYGSGECALPLKELRCS
ncbi:glutamate receptor ionotropic, kainate 2 [Arctopsyche grandis]|uniref:glutamate receptor ionotropic, kainate 2 n=1 Tax=Arctopsyche grandis TaxID=121162 RepID=UPI00406D6738